MAHNKSYKLAELAKLLAVKLDGDDQCEISGLGTLSNAAPGQLSFLSNPAYIDQLSSCKASAIIVEEKFAEACPASKLISTNPYVCFAKATALFDNSPEADPTIHSSASIDTTAHLDASVSVAASASSTTSTSLF